MTAQEATRKIEDAPRIRLLAILDANKKEVFLSSELQERFGLARARDANLPPGYKATIGCKRWYGHPAALSALVKTVKGNS